jgi:hypothetical protein
MRSPNRKALGTVFAAVFVALALTACATGRPSAATRSRTSSSRGSASVTVRDTTAAPGETLRQRAEADAAAILRSFAVPPGGHRLVGPPNLPGGVLKTPVSYLGATWEVHVTDFWEAPGSPQALLAWEQGHLTGRFTLGDADFGPPAWDRGFELAPDGALITRELDVEVASAGDGQTGIRVDAWVAWQPPRPAASQIPSAAGTVTIAESSDGGPTGSTASRLPAPVTITDPATVRRLATLVDGLPLSTIPPDAPCPFSLRPFLSLTFRARPGGPAVATVQTDQPCGEVALTVRGEQQPALQNEPTLDGRILTLAGLPWKLEPGAPGAASK